MQFLPIVERELRVAAHHPRTWWRRAVTLLLALAILSLTWLVVGRWANLSQVGRSVFGTLSSFAFVYAFFAGPLATADCLSRERREGTLGLLFLTDLKGYDVVLGKMAASSLDVMLGLMAALPVLTMPLLVGGVTLGRIALVVVALADVMLLSLAVGVFCSSVLESGRASMALTIGILALLTLGLPFIAEEALHVDVSRRQILAAAFTLTCPMVAIMLAFNPTGGTGLVGPFWLAILGNQLLALIFIAASAVRTGRHWREVGSSKLTRRWQEFLEARRKRKRQKVIRKTHSELERNPIAWLEGRHRLQDKVLAVLVCSCGLLWAFKHLRSPLNWPQPGWFIFWPILIHYVLCLWIAIQAPRRFADDKQSGALELLLCTPLRTDEIVHGTMSILWRRFGRALIGFVLLDFFLVHAYASGQGGWSGNPGNSLFWLCACAAIVLPLQGYAMARVGLYQGLAKANSIRASFTLLWSIALLPWALFICFLLIGDIGRRYIASFPRLSETLAFTLWAAAHLIVLGGLLARASWQLRHNFRPLASSASSPWWKRLAGIAGRRRAGAGKKRLTQLAGVPGAKNTR